MKIKHDVNNIAIDPNNPFENCKLGRAKYAEVLTSIVETYADGFVLAINNEWGTGKTTFVKMWQQHLNPKLRTIYFNAWENDFEQNPLAAIVSELSALQDKKSEKIFKSLIEKGAVLTKHIIPQIVKAIASKYIDTEALHETIEKTAEGITEIFSNEIKNYATKKKGFVEFREKLTEFIAATENKKPIVFFIDELDRCRPDYAVQILENVKHFFSVSGIVFVLSIDKIQLSHAIRGFYGSDKINSDEYLRRFIDVEYSIPEPNTKDFCKYLFDFFEFDVFFNSKIRKTKNKFEKDKTKFIDASSLLFDKYRLPLRRQEKIFANARIALNLFSDQWYIFPELFITLIFLKGYSGEFYKKFYEMKFSLEDMLKSFAEIVPKNIEGETLNHFIHTEAMLAYFYNNSLAGSPKSLLKTDSNGEASIVKSEIDLSENNRIFTHFLSVIESNFDIRGITHKFLLDKIELIEPSTN
ncbi:MAG: hypothetical protein A2275_17330 [Bacteroidetes bacterium RIFOXYA12_FULL_35_11]|nr:MAG: hypothetical protein A2X01_02620 [Bacteroidetes bacterium GWF2_35_48]OFY76308.1 MAG: hypothetical protein A2275_17330 [Bacteroidetes bacterium RIFOXYA12_FULL_35_11]HBX50381.1 hypothetical protein [Bacteroidales bacterium]